MNKYLLRDRFHVGGTVEKIGEQHDTDPKNDWGVTRNVYKVHLRRTENGVKQAMSLTFYTGIGWQRHPDLGDVIENLASDAATVDNDEFDDVQADAKTRRALIDQHARFKRLMGDQYTELVYETERN